MPFSTRRPSVLPSASASCRPVWSHPEGGGCWCPPLPPLAAAAADAVAVDVVAGAVGVVVAGVVVPPPAVP